MIKRGCSTNCDTALFCSKEKISMQKNNIEPIEPRDPLIAVYGIYKNEQTFIKRFLESVQVADEIVLCDTGATDETNNIIKSFIKDHPTVNLKIVSICVSPWRFDDARNVALSLVSPEIDICISLDIDEYLMENWKENLALHWEKDVTRYYHKFKTYWADGNVSEHWHERIHIRKGYVWKLPVHEILEYNGIEKIKHLNDFWLYQKPEIKDSRHSYLDLLEQSVKERKDVWKSWSFLANEYLSIARYDDALKAIDTALEIENSDKSYLHRQKFFIYKLQNKTELALYCLNTAIFHLSNRREPYTDKAKYLLELGRNTEAYFTLLEAEKNNNKLIDYHYDPSVWDDEFIMLKSKVLKLAKKDKALH